MFSKQIYFILIIVLTLSACDVRSVVHSGFENVAIELGIPKSFDSCQAKYPSILKVGREHWMYYNGRTDDCRTGAIGLAVSRDSGKTWQKRGVVLQNGNRGRKADHPSVLLDRGVFKMWLTLGDFDGYRIGYSQSRDGLNWSDPVDVLERANNPYERRNVLHPSVSRDSSGLFHMFYNGHGDDPKTLRLMHATSRDGLRWTRVSNKPVFGESYSYNAYVDFSDGFKMLVSTLDEGESCIFEATSVDGNVWEMALEPLVCNTNNDEDPNAYAAFAPAMLGNEVFYSAGDTNQRYRIVRLR